MTMVHTLEMGGAKRHRLSAVDCSSSEGEAVLGKSERGGRSA